MPAARIPTQAVDGVRAVLRIIIVFALTTPFWSLFDQKASTWVLQGKTMVVPHDAVVVAEPPGQGRRADAGAEPADGDAADPVQQRACCIRRCAAWASSRRALRRMGAGIAFAGVAWIFAGLLQLRIDSGEPVSLAWQVWPYLLLTFGEVLVSATALEFAYSQATGAMKGVIMAFWYLASTFGSLWVLLTNAGVRNPAVIRADRRHRPERERVPDVLLRRFRVPGVAGLRPVRAQLSDAGQLPRGLKPE